MYAGSNSLKDPVAASNYAAYCRARDAGHDTYVAEAHQFSEFYNAEQWDPAVKQALGRRPALTINVVLSTINAMLGKHIQQRAEIVYRPAQDTTQQDAEVLTKVVGHITEQNDYDWKETQVFADGLIEDRGYFDVRMDFTENLAGEVRISVLDPRTVYLDPRAKDYDPRTWSETLVSAFMTVDAVAETYGADKADAVRNSVAMVDFGPDSVRLSRESTFGDEGGVVRSEGLEPGLRMVRVIDRQYRRLTRVKVFVSPIGDTSVVPDNWPAAKVKAVAQQFGLVVMEQTRRRVRWTVTADNVVLHDDWSPYDDFTIVPFFPYFRRGRPTGVVRNLVSLQELVNKVTSQELHVVNTTANSGWIVEAGSLINMSIDDLERRGAETGLVLEVAKGTELAPKKIEPNQIPTGLDRISQKALALVREVSGTAALQGEQSNEVSGVALEMRQNNDLAQLAVPTDNMMFTRRLLARRLLECVQKFYTETRVFHITDWTAPDRPTTPVTINQPQPDGSILNDLTRGKYTLVVASAPARDSWDDTQFAEAMQLREVGVTVPDDVVIEYSHLSRRAQIAERVRQLMGTGEPSPEEQQAMQQERELLLKRTLLELKEMEAKVLKTQADARGSDAKADAARQSAETAAATDGAKLSLELKKLQAEVALALAELQSKIQIADLHARAKVATTAYQVAGRNAAAASSQKKPAARKS